MAQGWSWLGLCRVVPVWRGLVAPGAVVLGGSFVDDMVVVGYPIRSKLREVFGDERSSGGLWERLDTVSEGAVVAAGSVW